MAVITFKNTKDDDFKPMGVSFNNDTETNLIANGDTIEAYNWQGGSGNIEVSGIFDGATVKTKFNKQNSDHYIMNDSEAPSGGTFTSANIINITNLTAGFITFDITGGGGSQAIVIKIIKSEEGY